MKSLELIEASEVTSSNVQSLIPDNHFDYMARISGSTESRTAQVFLVPTDAFVGKWSQYFLEKEKDLSLLKGVVRWQHKLIDFNASYAALLLEQIDEEEFERVAESFVSFQVDVPREDLIYNIDRVHSLTGIEYSSSDYSNMFNCAQESIDIAMECLSLESNSLRIWSEGGFE
ncbi:hypothetical protein QMK54_10490 [Pseudomonas sp. P5_109]|uniref:hypothetical protein n=1 Tax=Pseudomonas sp. P5_109 TaxID=3043441 RepID=UPI002A3590AA|nr:hypothetical protein [Pseudomonas sp. P5_109]WPN32140.1 hypothetical protein QMK54_10490 [Pseudomonas sp. P5_109]